MTGVITRGSTPKLLWPGLNRTWGMTYRSYKDEWKKMFELNTSDKAYEEDVGLTNMGLAPEKPPGTAIQYDTMKQNFVTRYTNISYALGFIITREEIQDVLYVKFGMDRARALAFSMYQTKENVAANIFNRAFNASYTGGDGVSLCDTGHPTEGGTFSNRPATDVDFSEAALEQALIDISKFVDNRNNRIGLHGRKLLVAPENWFEAERILHNPFRPETADRDINAMYQTGVLPEGYMVNHYFSDADAWFILTDCPNGLRYFEREKAVFEDDNDFDTKNGKFSGYERYSFGWTDSRGAYGSPGA